MGYPRRACARIRRRRDWFRQSTHTLTRELPAPRGVAASTLGKVVTRMHLRHHHGRPADAAGLARGPRRHPRGDGEHRALLAADVLRPGGGVHVCPGQHHPGRQVSGRKLLIQEHTRHANRLHKVLEDTGITLTSVATRLLGASGRAMLDALVAGTTTRRSSLTSPGRGGPVAAVRLSPAPPRWITSYGTRPASPRLPWRSLPRGDPR